MYICWFQRGSKFPDFYRQGFFACIVYPGNNERFTHVYFKSVNLNPYILCFCSMTPFRRLLQSSYSISPIAHSPTLLAHADSIQEPETCGQQEMHSIRVLQSTRKTPKRWEWQLYLITCFKGSNLWLFDSHVLCNSAQPGCLPIITASIFPKLQKTKAKIIEFLEGWLREKGKNRTQTRKGWSCSLGSPEKRACKPL